MQQAFPTAAVLSFARFSVHHASILSPVLMTLQYSLVPSQRTQRALRRFEIDNVLRGGEGIDLVIYL